MPGHVGEWFCSLVGIKLGDLSSSSTCHGIYNSKLNSFNMKNWKEDTQNAEERVLQPEEYIVTWDIRIQNPAPGQREVGLILSCPLCKCLLNPSGYGHIILKLSDKFRRSEEDSHLSLFSQAQHKPTFRYLYFSFQYQT